jgi:hypothetical protein
VIDRDGSISFRVRVKPSKSRPHAAQFATFLQMADNDGFPCKKLRLRVLCKTRILRQKTGFVTLQPLSHVLLYLYARGSSLLPSCQP